VLIDASNVVLPDVDKVVAGKEWGEIWGVIPMNDHLTIVLADYTYTSTANLGGTINKKQTYAVNLPKFREPELNTYHSKVPSQAEPKTHIKSFRDCLNCPEMIAIPGKNYAIGKYEVTQAEWKFIMEADNLETHHNLKGDQNPAIFMDWDGTQKFISRLNQLTGKNYRLPTETEWEYACFGGNTQTRYCGSDDIESVAWYKENSWLKLRPVGQKQPNGYGLYDMSGNVWEWMDGCWKDNCDLRIVRGGSFNSYPLQVQDAYMYGKTSGGEDIGFRLARTLP
jgi:formylglycine-generating enzyme required for sulfatase activity